MQYCHLNRCVPICKLEICLMQAATAGDVSEIISLKQPVARGSKFSQEVDFKFSILHQNP